MITTQEQIKRFCYDMPMDLMAKLIFGKLTNEEMQQIIEFLRSE